MTIRKPQRLHSILCTATLLVGAITARADETTPRFCVIEIDTAAIGATKPDSLTRSVFQATGLPAPIYLSAGGTAWTFGPGRRLVPYRGIFPHSYLDSWEVEPWSGRVVASVYGLGLAVIDAGAPQSRALDTGAAGSQRRFLGPFVLPSARQTIVIASGQPFVVGADRLQPWLPEDTVTALDPGGLYSVHDAPSLGGQLVVSQDRRVFLLAGSRSTEIAELEVGDYGTTVDLAPMAATLFLAQKTTMLLCREGEYFDAALIVGPAAKGGSAALPFHRSAISGQVLHYGRGGMFDSAYRWQRVTENGLEDIPGGMLETSRGDGGAWGEMHDATSIGATIIGANDGLYRYDGDRITPIIGAEKARIGDAIVADLPGIRRTLAISATGLFEVEADGVAAERQMPFPPIGIRAIDWPEAGIALVFAETGAYALNAALDATPIPGGQAVAGSSIADAGTITATGDKVISTPGGLFAIIDTQRAGPEACMAAK